MRIARTMQWVGYALYASAGVLRVINGGDAAPPAWLAAYAVLGVALHVGASVPDDARHRRRRLGALAIMSPAMIAMAAIRPCPYGALTLVVVASQAALVLAPWLAAAWIVVHTAIIAACLVAELGGMLGAAEIIALLGFQGFAVAVIGSARREAEARSAFARSHAELLATRALLDEATRAQERTRIARDLHDVLGHDLTALSLQLEIASHVEPSAARTHTDQARALTARLLHDVRAVVAAMGTEHPPALAAAIRAIVVDAPGLTIHLDAPESLVVAEPRRADCVIRCVQEIVTNARRHALGAENLWIRLRREADELIVEAHDDGHGAPELRDGQGLGGMRSRLEEMGGWLEVRTAPERAFAVKACLPLPAWLGAGS
jgi:signal transduction histidine kinase